MLSESDIELLNGSRHSALPETEALEVSTRPTHYDGMSPLLALSSIFQLRSSANTHNSGHMYSRVSNPTNALVSNQLAQLYRYADGGEDSESTLCGIGFSSGMAAISTVLLGLTQQPRKYDQQQKRQQQQQQGKKKRRGGGKGRRGGGGGQQQQQQQQQQQRRVKYHILISNEVYYSVYFLVDMLKRERGIVVDRFDVRDIEGTLRKVRRDTRLVYLESCSNPTMKVPDFDELFRRIREKRASIGGGGGGGRGRKGAEDHQELLFVVDNTWMSPALFNPFAHGADIVVESGSKYLSGSSSVVIGFIVCKEKLFRALKGWRTVTGNQSSPMDSFLVSKGLDTLRMRMEHVSKSAIELGLFLEKLPFVSRVVHPGLQSHVDFPLAQKYFRNGFGSGVLYFHALFSRSKGDKMMQETAIVKHSTSFGSSHFLWDIKPNVGKNTDIPLRHPEVESEEEEEGEEDDSQQQQKSMASIEEKSGCWIRLSIGFTPVEDIKIDIARAMVRHAAVQLGSLGAVNVDTKVVQFTMNRDTSRKARHVPPVSVGGIVAFLSSSSDNSMTVFARVDSAAEVQDRDASFKVAVGEASLRWLSEKVRDGGFIVARC